MNDTEMIKGMYRQYWKYMIAKNEAGLRGMMSADYYLMHMTGARQSADEFISDLMGGVHSIIILRIMMTFKSVSTTIRQRWSEKAEYLPRCTGEDGTDGVFAETLHLEKKTESGN